METEIVGDAPTKQLKIKDMNFEQIKTLIDDTLNSIITIGLKLASDERIYEGMKHKYEIHVLDQKYSEEYEKYKSLTQKEEMAKIRFKEEKEGLIVFNKQLNVSKKELEHKRLLLKYLFRLYDEKVMNSDN